jgi:hypothetical protein
MIMGVGMVSLATLFPLGLLRVREANRLTRSTLLAESAMNDIGSRNLLSKEKFHNPVMNPYTTTYMVAQKLAAYDPWLFDTPSPGPGQAAVRLASGFGLPVAYDPLWRATVPGGTNNNGYYLNVDASEARFASGTGFLRADSSGGVGTQASAYGLQRLTNFNPLTSTLVAPANGYPALYFQGYPGVPDTIPGIFVSPEDIVTQGDVGVNWSTGKTFKDPNLSKVVPDMSLGLVTNGTVTTSSPTIDYRYSWMFTGHQADEDGNVFQGEIVVFENRPFNYDPVPLPGGGGTALQAAGETVVEAIFGFSPNAPSGYALGADKTILLRWPSSMPDPDVKVGSWIADVTYERNQAVAASRFAGGYPAQRCYWYQIVKRSTPADESTGAGLQNAIPSGGSYRAMTVWVDSPLKAKTQNLAQGAAASWVVNAALVCPYVVNVFPRTIYTR